MAIHRQPIMGFSTIPDSTGECFLSPLSVEMALGTGLMKSLAMVLKDPSADTGFYGSFTVPQNYVNTANIVVVGIFDGTTGTTTVSFQFNYIDRADNETLEATWDETVSFDSPTTSGYTTEDYVEVSAAALTDANFTAGHQVFFYHIRDQSAEVSGGFVGDFHVTGLYFEYNDA